jgi:hypothetical protein
MAIKTQISAILDKKMDRQDFLKHLAIGMVALSGIGTALKLLSPKQGKAVDGGYGSSAYGGVNDKNVG